MLSTDHDARNVTIPGRAGNRSTVAVDNIRLSLPENSYAENIQISVDKLNECIEDEILPQGGTKMTMNQYRSLVVI